MKGKLLILSMVLLQSCAGIEAANGAGISIQGTADLATSGQAVWRFWSPVYQSHFYTVSESERDKLLSSYADVWTYEGVSCRAFATPGDPQLAPVHRFWSVRLRAHFYTLSETEKNKLINSYSHIWTYEGIVFYAYPADRRPPGTTPLYRFWSGTLKTHFYTAKETEQYKLLEAYADVWAYEAVAWYVFPAEDPASASIIKGPCLQWPEANAITVMWETDIPAESRIDHGIVAPDEFSTVDSRLTTLHRMRLTDLQPDTLYTYSVRSGNASSPVGVLTAAPTANRSFRFAVYGDSRTYPDEHAAVIQSMLPGGPEIVFHAGDLVTQGRNYGGWGPEFFGPAQELMLTASVLPVPGNHEYRGAGPLWLSYFFDLPPSEGWFAMTYGNTRFIGLNTCVSYLPGSPQYNWLLQELESMPYASATWHVVIFHHPAFTCTSSHSDTIDVLHHLVPLFEHYGVEITFQGHSHAYERYLHNGIYYIVTGGGGGPLYDLRPDIEPPIRQVGRSVYHHCMVNVDVATETFTVTAVDNNGQVFDEIALSDTP